MRAGFNNAGYTSGPRPRLAQHKPTMPPFMQGLNPNLHQPTLGQPVLPTGPVLMPTPCFANARRLYTPYTPLPTHAHTLPSRTPCTLPTPLCIPPAHALQTTAHPAHTYANALQPCTHPSRVLCVSLCTRPAHALHTSPISAHALHTPCTRLPFPHTPCARPAHALHTSCTRLPAQHTPCTRPALAEPLHTPCTRLPPPQPPCTHPAHTLHTPMHVPTHGTACTLSSTLLCTHLRTPLHTTHPTHTYAHVLHTPCNASICTLLCTLCGHVRKHTHNTQIRTTHTHAHDFPPPYVALANMVIWCRFYQAPLEMPSSRSSASAQAGSSNTSDLDLSPFLNSANTAISCGSVWIDSGGEGVWKKCTTVSVERKKLKRGSCGEDQAGSGGYQVRYYDSEGARKSFQLSSDGTTYSDSFRNQLDKLIRASHGLGAKSCVELRTGDVTGRGSLFDVRLLDKFCTGIYARPFAGTSPYSPLVHDYRPACADTPCTSLKKISRAPFPLSPPPLHPALPPLHPLARP